MDTGFTDDFGVPPADAQKDVYVSLVIARAAAQALRDQGYLVQITGTILRYVVTYWKQLMESSDAEVPG